jgi:ParB family chromosome partitioning protein
MSRKALGRGLEALIPVSSSEPAPMVPATDAQSDDGASRIVPVDRIRSNPFQPRNQFNPETLTELSRSIKENGLIQPLVVRPLGDGHFELIAGERRFMASKQAGLQSVPVVVRKASRREMLEVALVENLQREDLNPVEEAEAFERLATEFGLTQEEIATQVGKSRTAVTNSLRLLGLEPEIRELVSRGTLSAGHGRALLAVPSGASRNRLVKDIVAKSLSVRQAEARAQGEKPKAGKPVARKRSHPALDAWEERLRTRFGTQVRIMGGIGRGKIEIHYFSEEDLERILDLTGTGSSL